MLLRMYLRWTERNGFGAVRHRPARRRRRGHQVRHLRSQRRGRLRSPAVGDRRSPPGAHLARSTLPRAATLRSPPSSSIPQVDDEIKIDIRPEDLRDRRVSRQRRGRPARQPHRIRRPHDAPADQHRGPVPKRAVAAQEPRQRHEATCARSCLNSSWRRSAKRNESSKIPSSTSTSAARSGATFWRRTAWSRTIGPSTAPATSIASSTAIWRPSSTHSLVWKKTGKTAGDEADDLPD